MSEWTSDEKRALGLYAVASRDFCDYLEMLDEPATTKESLKILLEMCKRPKPDEKLVDEVLDSGPGEGHDQELNDLMIPSIERRLKKLDGTPTESPQQQA